MTFDLLSVLLRASSFLALLQAAGVAAFLALFERDLRVAREPARRAGIVATAVALPLLLLQLWLEAARMAGAWGGLFDHSLLAFVVQSAGDVLAVRIIALGFLAVGFLVRGRSGAVVGTVGMLLTVLSFALTGHTAAHDGRWLLAPVLVLHLAVIAFWFGSLRSLAIVSRLETLATLASVTARFSVVAGWLVPLIFVAGVTLLAALLPDASALLSPYGLLALAKVAGFTLLMGLAALNRWQLAPRLVEDEGAVRVFRQSVAAESFLIGLVVVATVAMTTFFSPVT